MSTIELTEALRRATRWLAQDPDETTQAELDELINRAMDGNPAAQADIVDRFSARLAFGTAGLRGELGAGSNRMNRVLVAQAAAGFAAYLREKNPDRAPVVVIGYDGRRNSDVFARDSAEIFAGAGLRAILLPRLLPTPVLAFAVRHLNADAGVMVTASHNPPNDNGYKVYLGGADQGSQIVSPADAEIAAHIQRVADTLQVPNLERSDEYEIADESVIAAYVTATAAVAPATAGAAGLTWVYTAMHGVGWETTKRILETAGYPLPTTVDAQLEPDGRFPTVSFPNPEEPGAMDLSFEAARAAGAELIIANDPDADRLAVAIPADNAEGWRRLSGNEVGILLGWRAAAQSQGTPGASLACSLVSSPGLGAVADHFGLDFHETLTGFKWISRAPGIVFGFEEALGYLVNPETVRDKDGISAAIALLGMASEARARGTNVAGLIAEAGDLFGHFASGQVSIRVTDVSLIASVMQALRDNPPTAFGEDPVDVAEDLLNATDGAPAGDVLRYRLASGSRIIVRPSGTEPKLKVYLDARGDTAEDSAARVAALDAAVRTLLDSLT